MRQTLIELGAATPDETATALLIEFGSLAKVMRGTLRRARRVAPGDAIAIRRLLGLRALILGMLRAEISELPLIKSQPGLIEYLRIEMGSWPFERFRVLYLNTGWRILGDELVVVGQVDEAQVPIAAIMRRAVELGAARLVLAHNHPSGDPRPSQDDLAVTRRISRAADALNIRLYDHLIISADGYTSLREMRLM